MFVSADHPSPDTLKITAYIAAVILPLLDLTFLPVAYNLLGGWVFLSWLLVTLVVGIVLVWRTWHVGKEALFLQFFKANALDYAIEKSAPLTPDQQAVRDDIERKNAVSTFCFLLLLMASFLLLIPGLLTDIAGIVLLPGRIRRKLTIAYMRLD